jgi:hypothetical protein
MHSHSHPQHATASRATSTPITNQGDIFLE